MGTREKIIDKAREMFNEKGIEYVGMRELAAELQMRIGNITYYFPTKDELVYSLSEQYSKTNTGIHESQPVESLYDFLVKQELLFNNMIVYRCLLLSMVHLMARNNLISASYKNMQKRRLTGLKMNLETIQNNKSLNFKSSEDLNTLISANSLLARFWISEATLSGRGAHLTEQKNHYLRLLAHLFAPHATRQGLKEIERFLMEL